MQVHTFIAESAVRAVEQIRQQLGPQAVVLNVRKLPGEGLARLWQRPRIEVMAYLPEMPAAPAPAPDNLAELRQELAEIREQVQRRDSFLEAPGSAPAPAGSSFHPESYSLAPGSSFPNGSATPAACRTVASLLESSGLQQVHVQRVMDEVRIAAGAQPVESLADELQLARAALIRLWRSAPPAASNFHVFIGPPGAGKTTVLCKWLAQAALVEGHRARVWRLDSHVANTAESLSVLAEVLGVCVDRSHPNAPALDPSELVFVDLPGVNWNDKVLLDGLDRQLAAFPGAQVHLVLNTAYESQLLVTQARAYSALPVHDLILTHLDEEPRWGKLWNLLLGTNFSVAYFSAGQNVPGDFHPADPERLLIRCFPKN